MNVAERVLMIEKEISVYNHLITQAKQTVLDADVSKYPIFVATKSPIEIGVTVIDHTKTTAIWTIAASSLEEFVAKKVINVDKVDDFKKTYKDVDNYNCYFIISDIGNQFAYLPSHLK